MYFIIIRCSSTEEMRSMQEALLLKHPDAFYKIEVIDESSLRTGYEIAKDHGFEGTAVEFLQHCHTETGDVIDEVKDKIKAVFYKDDRLKEQYGMDNLAYDFYVYEACKRFV